MATVVKPSKADSMAALAEHELKVSHYRDALSQIDSHIAKWCAARHWKIDRLDKVVPPPTSASPLLPAYSVWELSITTSKGELRFKPVGYNIAGAEGRVDMYAYPSLYEVMLLLQADGTWKVRTHSGIDWPHPWNEETFVELTNALLKAE